MPQDERRKSPRLHLVEIQEPVTIELNPPLVSEKMEGMLLDLSEGGMKLLVPRIIPTQFTFRLSFQPKKLAPISAEGKILWLSRRETSYVAGVSFTQIGQSEQERISKLAEDFNFCEEKRAGGEAAFCVASCTYHPICKKPGRLSGETPVTAAQGMVVTAVKGIVAPLRTEGATMEKTGTPPTMIFPEELAKIEKQILSSAPPQAQKAERPKAAQPPAPKIQQPPHKTVESPVLKKQKLQSPRIAAFSLFGIIILLTAGFGVYLKYFMQKAPPTRGREERRVKSEGESANPASKQMPQEAQKAGDEKLAVSLALQGDIQKAILEMKTAHPEGGDSEGFLKTSKTALESEDFDSALLSALRALSQDEKDARGWFYLGLIFKKKHLYAHASAAYDRVLALKPQSSETMYEMASLYALMGDGENTAKWLKKALALNSGILQRAREDAQFDPLRSHPSFQGLLRP